MTDNPQRMTREAYAAQEVALARRWMIDHWLENQQLRQQLTALKADVPRGGGGASESGHLHEASELRRRAVALWHDNLALAKEVAALKGSVQDTASRAPAASPAAPKANPTGYLVAEPWPAHWAPQLQAALRDAYRPTQPRVPAGSPEGGQWTSGGGGSGRSAAVGAAPAVVVPAIAAGAAPKVAANARLAWPLQRGGEPGEARVILAAASSGGGTGRSAAVGTPPSAAASSPLAWPLHGGGAEPGEARVILAAGGSRGGRGGRGGRGSRGSRGSPEPRGPRGPLSPLGPLEVLGQLGRHVFGEPSSEKPPSKNARLEAAEERAGEAVARARSLNPDYQPPALATGDKEPEAMTRFYNAVAEDARAAGNRALAEARLDLGGLDVAKDDDIGGNYDETTDERRQRLRDCRVRLRNELVRVLTLDPDYPVPGNLGYYPAQIDVEQRIRNNETAAYFAKVEADRLEKLAYDPDKKQVDYPEMRAALVLERHFQLRFRRPEEAERGGVDFIDSRGRKWDLIGTSADKAMNYDGFIARLKEKIDNPAIDKVGVDTRLMGFEYARSVTREIRRMLYEDQNNIVKNKVVIIRTDGNVVSIDR